MKVVVVVWLNINCSRVHAFTAKTTCWLVSVWEFSLVVLDDKKSFSLSLQFRQSFTVISIMDNYSEHVASYTSAQKQSDDNTVWGRMSNGYPVQFIVSGSSTSTGEIGWKGTRPPSRIMIWMSIEWDGESSMSVQYAGVGLFCARLQYVISRDF